MASQRTARWFCPCGESRSEDNDGLPIFDCQLTIQMTKPWWLPVVRDQQSAIGNYLSHALAKRDHMPLRTWAIALLFLVVALSVPLSSIAQQQSGVLLEPNEQLFSVLAALNASGYDTGLGMDTGNNTRQVVRRFLAQKKTPVDADIRKFYAAHKIGDDAGADLGQFVSLALLLGPPPDFKLTVKPSDLPPDAKAVAGLVPLLKTFYQQAGLSDLWSRLQSRYQAEMVRYGADVRTGILMSDVYLRFPSGSYLGRTYAIYISLLGAPEQVQARIYGANYYLVVTPSKQSKLAEIRHQYLHFLLDPLALKYAEEINRKKDLRTVAYPAPMLGSDFKQDFPLLVTECLIRAVELRLEKRTKADAEKAVQDFAASGLILTPYFYSALVNFEQQEAPISTYYKQMILGIDVDDVTKKTAAVKFAAIPAPPEQKRPVAQTEEERLLGEGENLIFQGKYLEAKADFQAVLEKLNPTSERALYGLAATYSYTRKPDLAEEYFMKTLDVTRDTRIATWSHIYLGRIYDLEGKRNDALAQYKAASLTASAYPEALRAVQTGMLGAFGQKSTNE